MRIIVSGAAGFIGSALVSELAADHELVLLVHRNRPKRVPRGATVVEVDLGGGRDLRSRLPERIDSVVHLAQSHHYREFPEQARDIFQVNVAGCMELLEYARLAQARSFVYTSSGGVYGFSADLLAEERPIAPIDFYLSSKYSAELLVSNYADYFHTVILRPFFVYGPGQDGMLIPNLFDRVIGEQAITIEGKPGIRTNPAFVDDVVHAIVGAVALPFSAVMNIAGDEVVSIADLVERMARLCGREPVIRFDESASPSGDLIGDNTRMRELLGTAPSVALDEGLARVLESKKTGASGA